jgi:hypothetical protein
MSELIADHGDKTLAGAVRLTSQEIASAVDVVALLDARLAALRESFLSALKQAGFLAETE